LGKMIVFSVGHARCHCFAMSASSASPTSADTGEERDGFCDVDAVVSWASWLSFVLSASGVVEDDSGFRMAPMLRGLFIGGARGCRDVLDEEAAINVIYCKTH